VALLLVQVLGRVLDLELAAHSLLRGEIKRKSNAIIIMFAETQPSERQRMQVEVLK
jgi:hypothetical protein